MQEQEVRRCSAKEGFQWFMQAWSLLSAEPAWWVIHFLLFCVVNIVLGFIPLLGGLVLMLINPALVGGLLFAAHEQDAGRAMGVANLFQAFRDSRRFKPMLVLGLLHLLLTIMLLPLGLLVMGGVAGIEHMSEGMASGMPSFDFQPSLSLFVGLILIMLIMLLMALLFLYAIPLIMFEATAPLAAMKLSIKAGLSNIWPLSMLGLIFVPLWLLGLLSFGLGFLVVIPLLFISIYTSYKHIFKPRFSIEELV